MTTIITAAVFCIAVVGVALMIKNRSPKNQSAKTGAGPGARPSPGQAPSPASEKSPDHEFKAILEVLLQLNIVLRKDRDLPEGMTRKIETIIDDLTVITPAMMERYPGEALTYEIKKIGKKHLFNTVKEYLDLSVESRKNQEAIFEETIQNLHEVSHRSRDIVEKNETAEFKTMASFLAGKFS
jgi:hypothetical protein